MPKVRFVVWVSFCASLFNACGHAGDEPAVEGNVIESQYGTIRTSPDLRIVGASGVLSITPTHITMADSATAAALEVGQVIVSGDVANRSFLRRITGKAREAGGEYAFDTTFAALTEAIVEGRLQFEIPLTSAVPGPAPLRFGPQASLSAEHTWTFAEDIIDEPGMSFSVEGSTTLAPSLHFDVEITCNLGSKLGRLGCRVGDFKKIEVYAQGDIDADFHFDIEVGRSTSASIGPLDVAKVALPPVQIWVGQFPIIVNPTLGLEFTGKAGFSAKQTMAGGQSVGATLKAGVGYLVGDWYPIVSFSTRYEDDPVSVDYELEARAEAAAKAYAEAKFYEVIPGPRIDIGPYAVISAQNSHPLWKASVGLISQVKYKLAIAGWTFIDYAKTLFSREWVLTQAPPFVRITKGPPTYTMSPGAEFVFDAFGNESVKAYACSLDGAAFTACTSPKSVQIAPGSHTFKVVAIDERGVKSIPASYPWEYAGQPAPPAAPSSLVVSPVSPAALKLTFIDQSTNELGFEVERKTGMGPFARVALLDPGVTIFTDNGLSADTAYTYRVRAYGANGLLSAYTNEAGGSTPGLSGPPAGPVNLQAAVVSGTQINLRWTDQAANESGFRVERRANGGAYEVAGDVDADVQNFANTYLTPGVAYTFRVVAHNADGVSPYSNEAAATTPLVAAEPPAKPAWVNASVSGGQVTVNWADVDTADGYELYWSNTAGVDVFDAKTSTSLHTFVHDVPACGQTYYYAVRAMNAAGASELTAELSRFVPTCTPPPTPTGFAGTFDGNGNALSWAPSVGASFYKVYWGTSAGVSTGSNLLTTTAESFLHTGMVCGTAYYYRVAAAAGVLESALSAEISIAAPVCGAPATPASLNAVNAGTTNTLTWLASAGATSYRVYYGSSPNLTTSGPFLSTTSTSVAHTGLTCGTYYYKAAALNALGQSALSAAVSATVAGCPPAPTGLMAVNTGTTNTVSWQAVAGATSYHVHYSTSPGVGVSDAYLTTAATTVDHAGLGCATYYYVVTAVNASGAGAPSSPASATVNSGCAPPPTPTNFQATLVGSQQVLTWDAAAGATGYKIYWGLSAGTLTFWLDATTSPYNRGSLSCNYTYYYQISAVNAAGESAKSAQVAVAAPLCPADLSITGLTGFSPIGRGVVYWPTVTVARTGEALANGSYALVRVYLSSDTNIDGNDWLCSSDTDASAQFSNVTLNTAGTLSQQVLCVPPAEMPYNQNYYWGAIVDPVGAHPENDETNNTWVGSSTLVQ